MPNDGVLAVATRRAYVHDWRDFQAWCAAHDCRALPAAPAAVAQFLTDRAPDHGRSTLQRRLAAIGFHHRRAGLAWSPSDPAIQAALSGVARAQRRSAALGKADLVRLLNACPDDLAGLRDRALLLLGFVAALRRSELVGLNLEDLHFTGNGLRLRLVARPGHSAETRDFQRVAEAALCPARVLQSWIMRAGYEAGPLFRKVDRWGNVETARLGGDAVRRILLHRAALAGFVAPQGARLSPHGLRAGGSALASPASAGRTG